MLNDLSDIEDDAVDQLSAVLEKKVSISNEYRLEFGDCLEKMNELPPQSIDCIINDPPYGKITANDWDTQLDLEKMWECYLRVLKPQGTVVMFCCSSFRGVPEGGDPFTTKLMTSRPKGWRFFTLVFEKHNCSNGVVANRPLPWHEDIIVFHRPGGYTYNPQMRRPSKVHKNMGNGKEALKNPKSILPVFVPEKIANCNATNKPVGTMEWLVNTFTDQFDTVLDNTMGSGTTGVACANTYRNFVGIEADPLQFPHCKHRIEKAYKRSLREELDEDEHALDPSTIELPLRQPQFDVEDYMEFYGKVSQLSDYDLTVEWIVKYINQYFCIINGGSYEILECVYGVYTPMETITDTPAMESEREKVQYPLSYTVRKSAELKLRFRKCAFHTEEGKKADLFDMWSRERHAREYTSRVFDPSQKEDDDPFVLNTFTGLKANLELAFDHMNTSMAVHEEDFQIILDHIFNLVGGNNLYHEYLLDWLAFPIQTGQKTNVAVISQGGQGCGKSKFFVDFIGKQLYGDELFAKIAGGAQIGGDFNAHIVGKMYLAIEEPNQFSRSKLNLLKDLITSDVTEVNAKGKNQCFVDDYTNYVFTCNFIPEQMLEEDDRRYFIIQHNGDKVGDHGFYEALALSMETHAHEFFKFLKMRDIRTFVYGKAPPQTGIKETLLSQSIDPIFKYLRHLAETDTLANFYKRPSDGVPVLPFKAFFKNAVEWCDQEFETITWKRKAGDLKVLLKNKLGNEEACFEPLQVGVPDYGTGGMKVERCVLFPKTSTALLDLLMKKKMYHFDPDMTNNDDEDYAPEEPDDYESLLAKEAREAEVIELNRMKAKLKRLQEGDTKYDNE